MIKDYYKILELPVQASQKEIKKKFRRLALRYHPDVNPGNKYAVAWYREIQEAYETLSDDQLREAYHQKRWLLKSQGRSYTNNFPLTPGYLLKACLKFKEQVTQMDHYRMSHLVLQQEALQVLDDEKTDVLLAYNETATNRAIVHAMLSAIDPLEYKFLEPVMQQLQRLAAKDDAIALSLHEYLQQRKKQQLWDKYQGLIILALTLFLCFCIYFLNR